MQALRGIARAAAEDLDGHVGFVRGVEFAVESSPYLQRSINRSKVCHCRSEALLVEPIEKFRVDVIFGEEQHATQSLPTHRDG